MVSLSARALISTKVIYRVFVNIQPQNVLTEACDFSLNNRALEINHSSNTFISALILVSCVALIVSSVFVRVRDGVLYFGVTNVFSTVHCCNTIILPMISRF